MRDKAQRRCSRKTARGLTERLLEVLQLPHVLQLLRHDLQELDYLLQRLPAIRAGPDRRAPWDVRERQRRFACAGPAAAQAELRYQPVVKSQPAPAIGEGSG
jgi:hypothetical protein